MGLVFFPLISPVDINENLCKRFRQFLLDRLTGETPANYFCEFKHVIRAATKDNYWRHNPVDEVKSRRNPSKTLKENLEVDEYIRLFSTPRFNEAIKEGFLFSCYTGLRYVDAEALEWKDIKERRLTTRTAKIENISPGLAPG